MAERTAPAKVNEIVSTKEDLCELLSSLGVQKGMVIFLQANMKKLGYITGGEQTLLEALMETVGYDGTIVMPSFTPQMADPSCLKQAIDRESWELVRKHAQPFDRRLSAPHKCDPLIHQFLRNEGVVRSYHPLYSFSAWGKYAKLICDKHPLHFGLNQDSPLGKVVEFNGFVLMLGCDYKDCVMFQLARYRDAQQPIRIISAPIEINKKRIWKDMLDLDYNYKNFDDVGEAMEDRYIVKTAMLNNGLCRLFSAREAQNLATAYFHIHRD